MRIILMEEPRKDRYVTIGGKNIPTFRLRIPYARKAINLLVSLIPTEHRSSSNGLGFDSASASWKLPLEYWDDIESICSQVYPDLKLDILEELPEYVPFDINEVEV